MQHTQAIVLPDAKKTLDRLAKAAGTSTDTDLAARLGVPRGTIGSWKTRGSIPLDAIVAACKTLGLSFDPMTGQIGAPQPTLSVTDEASQPAVDHPDPQPGEQLVEIPLLVDIFAEAAGPNGGYLVDSEYFEIERSGVFFPDSYIRQVYGVSPDRVFYIHSRGRSMVPTIMPGQRVMIALLPPGTAIRDGLIYVINYAAAPLGGVLVKRLELAPDHVIVVSDNREVEDYRVPFEVWQRDYELRAVVLETAIRH